MAMDTSIIDSKDKHNSGQDEVTVKNGNSYKNKNGKTYNVAHINVNGNNYMKQDAAYKTDVLDDPVEDTVNCGIGPCTPKWLQPCASKQAFLVTFCLTWVLQGMFSTYFVSVITTIEKLFQLQSKMTGMIMSATEIGQICCTLLFTYYGGHGHRPRWIACGMALFAVCSFICSLPHFIFGYPSFTGGNYLLGQNSSTNSTSYALCHNESDYSNQAFCEQEILSETQSKTRNVVLVMFLLSLLGVGMGQTPVYTLGISYIDDNVTSRESALYFAITIGIRILGPALGFIMGSVCTRLYVDLSITPKITPNDPRWIGAWWLGLVLVAALLLLASFAMFAFPKRLQSQRTPPAVRARQDITRKNPSLKDFPKTIKRLLKNDILMYRTASSVLHILPIAGLYTFLPKFLESQFRFPAYTANMVTGVGGILVMGVGIIISGFFIIQVRPKARTVAAWIACAAILYAIGMGILMFVGCPMNDLADLHYDHRGVVSVSSSCAETCNCDQKFTPVCGVDKFTHFSPCYAGCQNVHNKSGVIEFSDCSCLNFPNDTSYGLDDGKNYTASIGYCDFECNNFMWYIFIFSFFVFIHSTSEVGSMLLTLRCVDSKDKAMALGMIQFAIGLFGNVPCSIIYGAVVDSACLVWEMVCGKTGACSLYDSKVFRQYFHGTTSAIMMCAFVVDLIVWYKADNINFENDEPLPQVQEEELTPIADVNGEHNKI